MKTPLKYRSGLKKLSLGFLIIGIIFIVLLVFVKSPSFLDLAEYILSNSINRHVEIGSVSLAEGQRIIIKDLLIKEEKEGDPHMVFPYMEIAVSPIDLLNRRVNEIIVKNARLSLNADTNGKIETEISPIHFPFIFNKILISNTEIQIKFKNGNHVLVNPVNISLHKSSLEGKAKLQGSALISELGCTASIDAVVDMERFSLERGHLEVSISELEILSAKNIIPPFKNNIIKGSVSLSADIIQSGQSLNWLSEMHVDDLSIRSKGLYINLKEKPITLVSEGTYDADNDQIKLETLSANLSQMELLTLSGELNNAFSDNPGVVFRLQSESIPFHEIKSFISGPSVKWLDEINTDGKLKIDLSIKGSLESPGVKGILSLRGKKFKRKNIQITSFDLTLPVDYQNSSISFRGASVNVKEVSNLNVHRTQDLNYRINGLNFFVPYIEYDGSGIRSDLLRLDVDRAILFKGPKKLYADAEIFLTGVFKGNMNDSLFRFEDLSLNTNLIKGMKGSASLAQGEPFVINASMNYENTDLGELFRKFREDGKFSINGKGSLNAGLTVNIPENADPDISGKIYLSLTDTGFSTSDETMIGEGIAMKVSGSFKSILPLNSVDFTVSSEATGFELLIGRFYGDFSDRTVNFSANGEYAVDLDLLSIRHSEAGLTDTGNILFRGDVSKLTESPYLNAEIEFVNISNEETYNFFIRETFQEQLPLLSKLKVNGTTSLKLSLKGSGDRFDLSGAVNVENANIHGEGRDIYMTGVNIYLPVDISYPETSKIHGPERFGFFKVKDLSWTKLKFKDLQAFPAIRHNAVFLKDDIAFPVFGGSIIFNNIVYNDIFSPGRNLHLSINVEGIDLAEASDTFNIPRFEGNLSGSISRASFRENRFRTDGEILLDVFDGKIKMKDLSIDNVFSPIASLRISLEIDEINLGKLTGTFDFGHVSGILRGYIQDLVIVNGQAESFKMAIETAKKKGIKQKINVEALKKISILGTGSSVSILDTGIYQFFKEYNYEKIGFKALLKNDNLFLQGIKGKGNVGYLVKGSIMPPKVDVVSYNQNISFKEVVNRLKRIKQAKR